MEQKRLRLKHLEETENNAEQQLSSITLDKQKIDKKIQYIEDKIAELKSKLKDKEELNKKLLSYKQKRDNVFRKLSTSEHRSMYQLRTSEHRSMSSYVRLSIDRCTLRTSGMINVQLVRLSIDRCTLRTSA